MNKRAYGVTLVELIIAISLLGVVLLATFSIDMFSRNQVMSSERRTVAQNEAAYVLEHMAKNISQAIGDVSRFGVEVRVNKQQIRVRWDRNSNGQADDADDADPPGWIAYLYNPGNKRVTYVSDYPPGYPSPQPWPGAGGGEVVSNKISDCVFSYNATDNYVSVEVSARFDPASPAGPDNPSVTMRINIRMPAVSVN